MKQQEPRGPNSGIVVGRDLKVRNVIAGDQGTINDRAEPDVAAQIAELKALIAELPGRDAVQAALAVGRIESAAKQPAGPGQAATISTALKEVEAAANSSVGVLGAAEKIVSIAGRLAKLLLL